ETWRFFISTLADVPILDGADNMAFVRRPKLDFHLVALQGLRVVGFSRRMARRPAPALSFNSGSPSFWERRIVGDFLLGFRLWGVSKRINLYPFPSFCPEPANARQRWLVRHRDSGEHLSHSG